MRRFIVQCLRGSRVIGNSPRYQCVCLGVALCVASTPVLAHHHEPHQTSSHSKVLPQQSTSIRDLMHRMWPGDLELAAVSEQGDIALVSWHYQPNHDAAALQHNQPAHHSSARVPHGEPSKTAQRKHGRALWRKVHGQWQLVSCAGKALLAESYLQTAGLTPSQAEAIVAAHRQAEARLQPSDVALFDAFMQLD